MSVLSSSARRVSPRAGFAREERGFTGAEKALLICFALAIIMLIAYLISGGSKSAASDAKRTLIDQGGSLAQLGQAVNPIQAAGPGGTPGAPGQGGNPAQPG